MDTGEEEEEGSSIVLYDWLTPQQRAAIASVQQAPVLPADAPTNLAAIAALRASWLGLMKQAMELEEQQRQQSSETDEKKEDLTKVQDLFSHWIRAVRFRIEKAGTEGARAAENFSDFLLLCLFSFHRTKMRNSPFKLDEEMRSPSWCRRRLRQSRRKSCRECRPSRKARQSAASTTPS